jgi:hypothetical protein
MIADSHPFMLLFSDGRILIYSAPYFLEKEKTYSPLGFV